MGSRPSSPAFSVDHDYDSCDNGVTYSRCESASPDYASSEGQHGLVAQRESISHYDYAVKEDVIYASTTMHHGKGNPQPKKTKANPKKPTRSNWWESGGGGGEGGEAARSHYSLASPQASTDSKITSKINVRLDSNQLKRLDSVYQLASEALGDDVQNLDDLEWEPDAAEAKSPVEDFFEMFKSPSPRVSPMSPKTLYTRGSPVLGSGGPDHPGHNFDGVFHRPGTPVDAEHLYELASPSGITSPLGPGALGREVAHRRPVFTPEPIYSSAGTNES